MPSLITGDGFDPLAPVGAPGGAPDPESTPTTPEFDRSAGLALFMRSVMRYQGGQYTGAGGAYGISDTRWDSMAAGAGLGGASMNDRAQQDYVAAYWMQKYYDKYRNWNLVAVAWKQGYGAADAIIMQTRKDPRSVTFADIKAFNPEVYGFVSAVSKDSYLADNKGYTEALEGLPPLGYGRGGGVTTVITGTGTGQPVDPFDATVAELYAEIQAEDKAKAPSGAEMLFAQLEGLSNVVSGGKGRVDWRHDVSDTVSSGGNPNELGSINEQEEDDGSRR